MKRKSKSGFQMRREEAALDAYFWQSGQHNPHTKRLLRLLANYYFIRNLIIEGWIKGICAVFGHQLVDHDPGSTEVGPDPDIWCDRCGK